ncbi:DUF2252 domain-containing protein [Tuberibacillus sp. Marseille-P3662]|uniref:DUF2252 domain-containing protein n=1 Tax=Tuberibacillus sp. Marseille-P3662 TaxID=1965358 RepID=UPI000A1CA6B9|nr:DUF2252 family protein [Tuberibacillus sp. Marseille-P3662]
MNHSVDRIEQTRQYLRKMTISTILNQYDSELLNLNQEQRQTKYKKMLTSPFQFYRGSAYLYYYDATQLPFSYHTPEDKPTWLQGDLHFENFGAFKDKQGNIVYDTNDFDEGYLGSYIYDVFRMAVSIALYSEEMDYSEDQQKSLIKQYLDAYYYQLLAFHDTDKSPKAFSFHESNTEGPVQDILRDLKDKDQMEALHGMTTLNNGIRQFREDTGLIRLSDEERSQLEASWGEYLNSLNVDFDQIDKRYFTIKDAVKIFGAGTGSIGLTRYFILIEGIDSDQDDDVILEAKEARIPAPAHFFTFDDLINIDEPNHGRRVIKTQRAMHYLEDPYLGHFSIGDHDFYVRENTPYDEEVSRDALTDEISMGKTVNTMGKVTAKVHARADEDAGHDFLTHQSEQEIINVIDEDLDGFKQQLTNFSIFYKHQVHTDFKLFQAWCANDFGIETD